MAFRDERTRPILLGAGIILGVGLLLILLWMGTFLPGAAGEIISQILGTMFTPIFLEFSFFFVGVVVLILVNTYQRKRDGEELVYLDEVKGPDVPGDMPDKARFAIYEQPPLPGEVPSVLDQIEGALAIGDLEQAATMLADLDEEVLHHPRVLFLRLDLAKKTGHDELANTLEAQIAALPKKG